MNIYIYTYGYSYLWDTIFIYWIFKQTVITKRTVIYQQTNQTLVCTILANHHPAWKISDTGETSRGRPAFRGRNPLQE